ncbi:O-succinylbenzoate synthase [Haloactinopolyspora alba]|uniref:o-succinylbenzoate synthase n=1 Tax=Haloactinopolyspora alba TaxID=648780 RepID=A0A2P8E5T7_9ACTN|nr:o-succinylbenzoate synthase [Haloactinopolyspora alba]PSL04787.1 O-succinylbenzoate synthase [Haloactinopolyspora alba]
MLVTDASLHVVRLPLVHRFRTSSHAKDHLDHILVRLVDESGDVGWGEIASPSDPYYSPETVDTCRLVAERYLLPALIGRRWEHPDEVPDAWARVRGHRFAKAGVEMAAWTLWSGHTGVALATALGGTRTEVVAGVSLGIEPTVDALLAEVQRQVDAGYPRVKLKIAPGWDAEPVRAVRAAFPGLALHVDANGAYGESDEELAALRALDSFGLTMIEQPFAPRNFVAHAALQRGLTTPICLDESVDTLDDLRTAVALDAGRVLNIKVSRMGGLGTAKAAHDLAAEHGIPVWCGGMHEFGVGRAANVALSSLPGFTLPSDVSASAKYYERDVIDPPVTADNGVVTVPTAPGLGHDVDVDVVTAATIVSATVPAAPTRPESA